MTSASDDDEDFDPPLGSLYTVVGYALGAVLVLVGTVVAFWRIEKGRRRRKR